METKLMTPDVFGAFSLIEWLLFGFISANAALAGIYVIHNSLKRLGPPAKE